MRLREVIAPDLDCVFVQQLDPRAHWQAGFSSRDPSDRAASRRVLEKCGFLRVGHERAFADARLREIGEFVYRLDASCDE